MTIIEVYDENELNLSNAMLFDERKDAEEHFAALIRNHLQNKCSKSDIEAYIKKGYYRDSRSFHVRIKDF